MTPSPPPALSAILDVRLAGADATPVDVHLAGERIASVEPAGRREPAPGPVLDAGGRIVVPAFVDAHVHLDKALLLDRLGPYDGGLDAAIAATAAVKSTFTTADIEQRAQRVLEDLAARGVCAARVHVEIDPIVGLDSVHAHLALRERWADRLTLQLVAFPQEGSLRDRRTGELLDEAMRLGCDVVGACPYADVDGPGSVLDGFDRAQRFGADLDLHLDFTDDPSVHLVDEVCEQARARGMEGHVAIGHVTSLSAMEPSVAGPRIARIAAAGVAVIALPATDLYLSGRGAPRLAPRGITRVLELLDAGVAVSLATNNHANAFTPVTSDPLRMAWLAMLMTHAPHARWSDLLRCVTAHPAATLGLDVGVVAPGARAELVVLDTHDAASVVSDVPAAVAFVRRGRWHAPPQPRLLRPLAGRGLAQLDDDAIRALDVDVAPAGPVAGGDLHRAG
jgi:cytosine deaminase